jgi:hypothetical protein
LITDLEDLIVLKEQLQVILAETQFREHAAIEALRPKSPGEVELVRRHLKNALSELDAVHPPGQQPPGKQE